MPYKDPEKRKAYEKRKLERIKSDPVLLAKRKEQSKLGSKKYWEKIKSNPQLHEEYKEKHREIDKKRDRNTEKDKQYRKERWEKIKSDDILLEKHSERTRIGMKKYKELHKDELTEKRRNRKREIKNELFKILGGSKCIYCSESREEALNFDHIENNGYQDYVKKFHNHAEVMRAYYVNNPDIARKSLQVLCGNCNLIRRFEHERFGFKINSETKVYKDKIFQIFDNRCSKCGFNNISCLTLDHRKGEGRKERKSRFGGYYIRFYKYYSEHPEEAKQNLELLCFNCNLVKKHLNGENTYQY
jgi:hypothetical protein